ncbi:LysM peptidoglycan-binding domain-containing protein [Anaerobutyricum hallii]|uniref:LysM peptidoglycan-binding domain-containing protein n=1 Tax=Anaerobutyricum hallii TaxID=39488 RepID=A0A414B544_9FIRM|nr:LysM peptidoglycan-binding domain-containing protein [Anaerobutyricum hallii]
MKEFRKPSLSTYKKKKKKKAKKSKGGKRTNNKAKTKKYIVKKGDSLWNLAKKFYKDGKKQTKIYNANKSVIEKAAKKHGKGSSGKGKWIYPGTKLTIP